jgi:hypothetical protein
VRHTLTSLLLAAVAAVLAGARSFTAIGEWAADVPPRVLAALGVRYDPLARRFQPDPAPPQATERAHEVVYRDQLRRHQPGRSPVCPRSNQRMDTRPLGHRELFSRLHLWVVKERIGVR